MKVHRVIFEGGAQTIKGLAVDSLGQVAVPTSATYSIVDLRVDEDDSTRTIQSSTAGTVDSASATTDAAAGSGSADKHAISVDSSAGFSAGSTYLLSYLGQTEEFVCARVDSTNGTLYARDPLTKVWASGSSVVGCEVSATFPAAEAASDWDSEVDDRGGPYAIDWVWVGVSPTRRRDLIYIDRVAEKKYATRSDVAILDHAIAGSSRDALRVENALEQAHRDLQRRIRELKLDPSTWQGGDTARDFVTYRAAYLLRVQQGSERDQELADKWDHHAKGILANLGAEGAIVVDKNNDEEADTQPRFSRVFRPL